MDYLKLARWDTHAHNVDRRGPRDRNQAPPLGLLDRPRIGQRGKVVQLSRWSRPLK
jgi:hypothetical protein